MPFDRLRRRAARLVVCASLFGAAAACGGGSASPAAPSPPPQPLNVAGGWTGTWTSVNHGIQSTESAQADLTQTNTDVTGTVVSASGVRCDVTAKASATGIDGSLAVSFQKYGLQCNGVLKMAGTLEAGHLHIDVRETVYSYCDLGESVSMEFVKR